MHLLVDNCNKIDLLFTDDNSVKGVLLGYLSHNSKYYSVKAPYKRFATAMLEVTSQFRDL